MALSGIPKTRGDDMQSGRREFVKGASVASAAFAAAGPTVAHAAASTNGLGMFNVKDYGAIGNGTTDCIGAINQAIAAAAAGRGGIVFFPPGIYAISSAITLPTVFGPTGSTSPDGSVWLLGSGRLATTIRAGSSFPGGQPMLWKNEAVWHYGTKISDLSLDGQGIAGYNANLWAAAGYVFDSVMFFGATTANVALAAPDFQFNSQECLFSNCRFVNMSVGNMPSFNILNNGTDNHFSDCIVLNAREANICDARGANRYTNVHCYGWNYAANNVSGAAARIGFWMKGYGGLMSGCGVDNATQACVQIDQGGIIINSMMIQQADNAYPNIYGIFLANNVPDCSISGVMDIGGTIKPTNRIYQNGTANPSSFVYGNPGAANRRL